jgi:aryl carrier-like protein
MMTGVLAAIEGTLCRILAEVLDLDRVGPQDGFFEVGGDSVLAVSVVARAREAGLALSVRDLFDHQTAGELAAVIDDRPATSGAAGDSADSPASPKSPLLTFADDEFGEFEDDDAGADTSGTEAEWEAFG